MEMGNGKWGMEKLPTCSSLAPSLLRSFNISSFRGIHADAIAFINKGWDGDCDPVFERGRFVDVGNSRTLHGGFRTGHGELKGWWKINADRCSFIKLGLQPKSGVQPLCRIAQVLFTERDLFVILSIHEVVMGTIGIQVL